MPKDSIADLDSEALWEASLDGLLLVDDEGRIVATNPSLGVQFGYRSAELVGESVEVLVPREQRTQHVAHRNGFVEHPVARPMASRNLEGLRKDGTRFHVNVSLAPVETSTGRVTLAAVRDLTARVEHDAALAEISRRRAIAADHERIANDLHDSVIQRLFALGLGMQGLPGRIEDQDTAGRVASAVDALDEIIADIRSTIYGLRQQADHETKLGTMILATAEDVTPTLGFVPDVTLSGSLDKVSNETLKNHVVLVVREALSNAGKHARATSVAVTVRLADGIHIEVVDDGRGFDPEKVMSSGLANMAHRAEACGGTFAVTSVDGGGTRVAWSVPGDRVS